ncbi:MAG: guanylate kinase [Actinomycetota bacterium]
MFVLAGPSGVGKGTLVRRLLELIPDLRVSISVTTRPPRATERDGVDYRFISDEEFDRLIEQEELLEWAEIFGHRSGTPTAPVRQALDPGTDVLLELDVQGARQVRERVPEAVLILLEPPSLQELERRLRSRGTEDEARLADRLAKAGWELEQRAWFNHVVTNDDVETAAAKVAAIIDSASQDPSTEGTPHP